MDIQRVRNLTTGRLHTKMEDIYADVEWLTGAKGVMTHQLPNALRALEPYLREKVAEARFWDGEYDTAHTGEIDIPPMGSEDLEKMWRRYSEMPSPLSLLADKA